MRLGVRTRRYTVSPVPLIVGAAVVVRGHNTEARVGHGELVLLQLIDDEHLPSLGVLHKKTTNNTHTTEQHAIMLR